MTDYYRWVVVPKQGAFRAADGIWGIRDPIFDLEDFYDPCFLSLDRGAGGIKVQTRIRVERCTLLAIEDAI